MHKIIIDSQLAHIMLPAFIFLHSLLPLLLLLLLSRGGEDTSFSKYADASDGSSHLGGSGRPTNYFSTAAYGEGHPLCAFLDNKGYTIVQFGGSSCRAYLEQKNR